MNGKVLARWAGLNKSYVSPFLIISLVQLAGAMMLGGASRENGVPAAIVELISIAVLPWAIHRLLAESRVKDIIWPLAIIALIVLIALLQLIPLPPALWSALPGRHPMATVFKASGIESPAHPLTLAPDLTVRSALYLVTPISVFLSWVTLSSFERRLGGIVVLIVMVLGLVLGAVQLAAGGANVGYLYRSTNIGALVGFFSNRNHEASLLLCALPLTAGLLASGGRNALKRSTLAAIGFALILVVIGALGAVHSRAGVLLFIPVLLASLLLIIRSGRFGQPRRVILFTGLFIGTVLALVTPFALAPLMSRFDTSISLDERFAVAPTIWAAAMQNFPFGSGLGTFDIVYRSFENLNFVSQEFLNHAHNDYLEIFLEAGLLGAAAVLALIIWWLVQTWRVWAKQAESGSSLSRAGVIIIGILLVHSAFDYPMRTLAIGAVFGFAAALTVSSPRKL